MTVEAGILKRRFRSSVFCVREELVSEDILHVQEQ